MSSPLHIYLSPHLDDAILSCGGFIHRQRAAGEPVLVMTLCAGSPDYGQLTSFAQQYHAAWGNLPDVVASRRTEDRAVLDKWGARAHHCNTLDSLYRHVDGKVTYPDLAALFAEPHPQELDTLPRLWQQELECLFSNSGETIIYAPVAAGNHVDHQLVRVWALRLIEDGRQVWFYEDFTHVESPGALQRALACFGHVSWQARTISIDVNAKIAAIRGYETQIALIFGDEQTMVRRIKRFTVETACHISLGKRIRRRLAGLDGRRERI